MNAYIVTEKQDANSSRKGVKIEATNLAAAKRKASSEQMFQNTVMTIESEAGALLAVKADGRWKDASQN